MEFPSIDYSANDAPVIKKKIVTKRKVSSVENPENPEPSLQPADAPPVKSSKVETTAKPKTPRKPMSDEQKMRQRMLLSHAREEKKRLAEYKKKIKAAEKAKQLEYEKNLLEWHQKNKANIVEHALNQMTKDTPTTTAVTDKPDEALEEVNEVTPPLSTQETVSPIEASQLFESEKEEPPNTQTQTEFVAPVENVVLNFKETEIQKQETSSANNADTADSLLQQLLDLKEQLAALKNEKQEAPTEKNSLLDTNSAHFKPQMQMFRQQANPIVINRLPKVYAKDWTFKGEPLLFD
jgi:hypothetical protein